MNIGLVDVDGHNFPNLALMKIAAWHKAHGDHVEWWWGFAQYDRVYMSKVFDETYSPDIPEPTNTAEIVKGGTGYFRRRKDGKGEVFYDGRWVDNGEATSRTTDAVTYNEFLPYEVEHMYPDYGLYPELTKDTAYGFLSRGCPRDCSFCSVAQKEGRRSYKVADLSEWWDGQKNIVLCDPNLLACHEHMELLGQLCDSRARVDFSQGLDIRLISEENVEVINRIRVKDIHFAWDDPNDDLLPLFYRYKAIAKHRVHGSYGTVYVLTNFGTTLQEDLYRIYSLRDLGFDPYVMVYDKPNAPQEKRLLQRWCNNRLIFNTVPKFEDYDSKRG